MNGQKKYVMPPIEDADFTGQTIDRYVIVAHIGSGNQGRVYRGRDVILQRPVAIKVVNLDDSDFADARQSLIAEARALSSLSHPNVAGMYDFVTHGDRDFMVMEFIAGATLDEVVAGGPLPPSEVVRLGAQLARGLAAVHAAQIVHCDIKPANLKITSAGALKIFDFGIAKRLRSRALFDHTPATSPMVAGTLPYMAPEVLRGQREGEQSDIYSMGAVLYEMATAGRAFPQRTLPALLDAIEEHEAIAPSRVNPVVPVALDRVILKALNKMPGARYETATELAQALEGMMPQRPTLVTGPARSEGSRCWHLKLATRRWWGKVERVLDSEPHRDPSEAQRWDSMR